MGKKFVSGQMDEMILGWKNAIIRTISLKGEIKTIKTDAETAIKMRKEIKNNPEIKLVWIKKPLGFKDVLIKIKRFLWTPRYFPMLIRSWKNVRSWEKRNSTTTT